MTDELKRFLEIASQDKELIEKLSKAEKPEAVIALAAEKGFALTAEDLKQLDAPASEALSDDELDAVSGGQACACILGGVGELSSTDAGQDGACICLAAGAGIGSKNSAARCACPVIGGGTSFDYE